MSGRCKDCRHWGDWTGREHLQTVSEPPKYEEVPRVHKPCACPKVVDGSDIQEAEQQALPLDTAIYSDSESYGAHFFTGPEFGCVHWGAKAAEKPA
jgi:hypothetical protein